jgi:hypothetical protein
MLRTVAVALFCVAVSGIAIAQQSKKPDDGGRPARPGESCLSFHRDCGQWCDANQSAAAGKASCKNQCNDYQSTCLATGVWKTPITRGEIRGLPVK